MTTRLDRRLFLQSSGLAAAGVAALAPAARSGEFTGKIKKAVKYQMISGDQSAEDKLRMLKDLGFDGVEPGTQIRGARHDARELARASEKVGLPVHGVVNSSHPDIKGAIDEAVVYGATSVLHVVSADRQGSYLKNYRRTQQIIRDAIPYAEKKKVHILIENVWASFLIEPLSMARYLDELASPYVKCYFDVGNVVRWGWPHHWIEVLGDRIVKLDIKEYNLDAAMSQGMRKGFDFPLGEGSIDWARVRRQLADIDYRGWATAEVRGGNRQRLADIAEQMNRVLSL